MLNLYNKFVMVPPTREAVAGRLLAPGQDRRVAGVAPPVHISRAPSEFFRRADFARSSIQAPTPAPAIGGALGGLGSFMGGPFSGAFGNLVVTGLSFSESWGYADFMGQQPWLTNVQKQIGLDPNYGPAGSYSPPDASWLANVRTKWDQLRSVYGADAGITSFVDDVKTKLQSAIAQADELTRQPPDVFAGRRSAATEAQRIQAFNAIKAQLTRIASVNIPTVATPGSGTGGASPGIDLDALRKKLAAAQNTGSGATGPAPGSPLDLAQKESSTGLLIGGAVGLTLLGLGVYIWKRKKG